MPRLVQHQLERARALLREGDLRRSAVRFSTLVANPPYLADPHHRVYRDGGGALGWEELDPDVFGEELDEPSYRDVERMAAIGVAVLMP